MANAKLAMSCKPVGFFNSSTECQKKELDVKVKKLFDSKVYGDLYGKYKNSWGMFEADGMPLPLTEKFGGHHVYGFERENGVDTLILGPVLKRPAVLQLMYYGSEPPQQIAIKN